VEVLLPCVVCGSILSPSRASDRPCAVCREMGKNGVLLIWDEIEVEE